MRYKHRSTKAVISIIRSIAFRNGWAIGVHGSLARDIDLIAVPWTKKASKWRKLWKDIIKGVPLWDCEGGALGLHRGAFGRIKTLSLQPGARRASNHPKGHWKPMAIDLSIVDPREYGNDTP